MTGIEYGQVLSPFAEDFYPSFIRVANLAFDSRDLFEYLSWRMNNMPDVSVFTAEVSGTLVGFKAGYAVTNNRYYSWLGGLDPEYRRLGIATRLMEQQHKWLRGRYAIVETHVEQANKAMVQLNINSGLVVTGLFFKNRVANFIMQKKL